MERVGDCTGAAGGAGLESSVTTSVPEEASTAGATSSVDAGTSSVEVVSDVIAVVSDETEEPRDEACPLKFCSGKTWAGESGAAISSARTTAKGAGTMIVESEIKVIIESILEILFTVFLLENIFL